MPKKLTYEQLQQKVEALEARLAAGSARDDQAFLSAVLDNIGEAIVICDANGRLIRFNEAARTLHGLPEHPIPPGQWAGYYDLYQMDGVTPLETSEIPLFRALQGERVCNAEIVVVPKNSEPHYLVCSGQALSDEKGRPIGAVVAMHDITKRKQAEDFLRESENRFQRMLSGVPDMISVQSPDMDIIYSNWAGFAAVPESRRILNTKCYRTYRGYDDICPDCLAKTVLETRQPMQTETRLPDGTWLDLRVIPIFDKDQNVDMFMEWVRDITEREKLQHQLHQAQKMESIGRLAGGVAHDLNNLLSPILGYSEMLLEDLPGTDRSKEQMKEIVRAGSRAQDLVRQLLAFCRRQPLQFQAMQLNMLLEDFKKLLRRTLREDIKIHWRLAPSLPQIQGDPGQLEQVILNLAVNAQDAMLEGGMLTLETARVELDENYAKEKGGISPGPYVMLAISDTGTGMDAQTLEHLFEPFFTTKEKGKGTGLGMSTAYGIVKQHGGSICAYSQPGFGTTMKVYLPVADQAVKEMPARAPKSSGAKGSETVLLAEDDQQVRDLAAIALQRFGYNVLAAANGREALAILENLEGPLHLLFTDVIMPDMNGKELFEQISRLRPEARVLFMSGYTDDVIAHHGVIDAGIPFIGKPFNLKALAEKIREVLDD
ncbi:MAG: ATP-binding protein [Thermodesulfobacteriota bacterium]